MTSRLAKVQPWYHISGSRCDNTTLAKEQCLFTASYTAVIDGRIFNLCKPHADMLRDIQVTRIRPKRVHVR